MGIGKDQASKRKGDAVRLKLKEFLKLEKPCIVFVLSARNWNSLLGVNHFFCLRNIYVMIFIVLQM